MAEVQLPADQGTLESLLSRLAGRLDGAVDFWPVVCLISDQEMADRKGFIVEKSAGVRALVCQIEAFLASADLARESAIAGHLAKLAKGCDDHEAAFLVLVRCRTASLDEIRSAVERVKEARRDMLASIAGIQETLDLEVPYWKNEPPQHSVHIDDVLAHLFDTFRNNLRTAPTGATA